MTPDSKPCIAVDAMGGDYGPSVVVPATIDAANQGIDTILVGDEARIQAELDKAGYSGSGVRVVHAAQVVEMDDKPADALRRKRNSSIQVACKLVKKGEADGVVSAGNSGATVACGMFILGRIKGVERPALAGFMPTEKKPIVLIDVGANVDSKPYHLVQFGIMADVLSKYVLKVDTPRVGLLSIGEEEGKGNVMVKESFDLFKQSSLNFIGNVEGRDVFTGDVDVVVCDGFVGNVALKLSEGLAVALGNILKGELKRDLVSKLGAMLSMGALTRFARLLDYAEHGGGAPLLGLKSIAVVCHGASNCKALTNAVKMASTFVATKANEHLAKELEAHCELAKFGRPNKG